jgi:hypothetical protein
MIRRLAILGVLLAITACSGTTSYYGEEFSNYYQSPREETSRRRLDSKEIVHWATNPKTKKRIGFYETWEISLKGSRETRECHYIKDASGIKDIGFVTNEGVFYRFDSKGEKTLVGEYTIVSTGLKIFFGIPIKENVDLEDIDPYK